MWNVQVFFCCPTISILPQNQEKRFNIWLKQTFQRQSCNSKLVSNNYQEEIWDVICTISNIKWGVRLLLVESLVIIFYVIFLMGHAVLFWKKKIAIKRKQGVNNCFKPVILAVCYCCFQIKIRTKRKEKINLETKYNMI